jgi:hypothetical protein
MIVLYTAGISPAGLPEYPRYTYICIVNKGKDIYFLLLYINKLHFSRKKAIAQAKAFCYYAAIE